MHSFKNFLLGEATTSVSRWEASIQPLLNFLEKHLGLMHRLPGVESFTNSGHGEGKGLRFFHGDRGLRFNFRSVSDSPYSIDVYDGHRHPKRTIHIFGDLLSLKDKILAAIKGKDQKKRSSDGIDQNVFEAPQKLDLDLSENDVKVTGPSTDKHESKVVKKLEDEAREAGKVPYEQQLTDLEELVKGVVDKNLANAIFVGGRGGTGKTHTVERVLSELGLKDGNGFYKVAGSATPAAMYRKLFDYRNSPILFDDSDTALESQEGRNIIKQATDTKKVRKISWERAGGNIFNPDKPPKSADTPEKQRSWLEWQVDHGGIPSHFNFSGKVIFISNLPLEKLDPDGALRTRAYVVTIDPTNKEVLDYMAKIVDKVPLEGGRTLTHDERMEVIEELKHEDNLSLRKLVRGLNMRAAGMPNWRRLLRAYA